LFLVGDFDAMVNYEALILETNQQRIANNKEPLYMVYPVDGTTIADYSLGYINNGNDEQQKRFQLIQDYLLSETAQAEIQKLGRRTGYGGVLKNVDAKVFVPEWGFDANRVLSAINFPESDVMLEALNLYQTTFKKPSFTVFLLDFSGSMTSNQGELNLKKGMELILDQTIAKQNLLQGSIRDTIVVIPFNDKVIDVWKSEGTGQYPDLLKKINKLKADGGTNIYNPAITALDILKDVNQADYTTSITLMTDGRSEGSYSNLEEHFKKIGKDIPIYSILFGDAQASQLKGIANLTKADVFDSNGDLVAAFKKARGYN
jgi:Ca-activated chloride channel family protein